MLFLINVVLDGGGVSKRTASVTAENVQPKAAGGGCC
jgi:hypothetical protein